MSNPSVVSLQLAVGVATAVALAQTPAAAGALILNGTKVAGGVATFDIARRVLVTSANGADSGLIVTINGTNASGAPITDTVTVVGGSTAYSTLDFLTVTSVTISAASAGNISVGTNNVASTPWVLDNFLVQSWNLSVACRLVSGAATYTVEHTYDDPNTSSTLYSSMEPASFQPPFAWANPTLQNFTVSGEFQYDSWPIMAHRLTITAGQGKVVMQTIQSGLGET